MELIKKNIVIIIFVIICIAITILTFIISKINKSGFEGYFVYSNIASYKCNTTECNEVTNEELDRKKLEFNIYLDNLEYKNSYLKSGKVWNVFDKNNNYISSPIDFFAYSGDFEINIYDKDNTSELTDDDKLYIKNNFKNISLDNLEYSIVYNINLDDNDIRLVILSNFNEDTMESKNEFYTFAYLDVNNNKNIIYKKTFKSPLLVKSIYLNSVYKINDDIYFAVKQEKNFNPDDQDISIYKIDKDKILKMN